MLIRLTGFLILTVYFLVLTVSLSEGPLVSLQSYFLGVIGLVFIFLLTSSIARKINLVDIGNQPRKDHTGAIPLVGGMGLFVSLIYGAFVFGVDVFYLYLRLRRVLHPSPPKIKRGPYEVADNRNGRCTRRHLQPWLDAFHQVHDRQGPWPHTP